MRYLVVPGILSHYENLENITPIIHQIPKRPGGNSGHLRLIHIHPLRASDQTIVYKEPLLVDEH